MSSGGSVVARRQTAHDFFRQSYWQCGRYQIQAYCGDYHPLQLKTLGWEVRPIDFTSGTASFRRATPTGTHCASYVKSSSFSKDESTAMTWTNGVSTNTSHVDVDLSARSGWSTQVKLGYKFTRGSGSVCGTLAAPGATTTTPGDLSAK